jgi:hypothetical protein
MISNSTNNTLLSLEWILEYLKKLIQNFLSQPRNSKDNTRAEERLRNILDTKITSIPPNASCSTISF